MSNDGKCLALSCLDSKIRLMERASGEMLSEYKNLIFYINYYIYFSYMGHKSESYTIECKFLWDDGYIIAGSEDAFIYIYNVLEVT